MTTKHRIKWYRTPLHSTVLAELNQRSDWKGLVHTVGHLLIMTATGLLAWYATVNWSSPIALSCLFLHGTVWAFIPNGGHELCHRTVFKTKFLNTIFRNIYSFLGWYNHIAFWESHQEHHKYTLHPPDDLEVILPRNHTVMGFLSFGFINPMGFYRRMKSVLRMAFGYIDDEWMNMLFPEDQPEKRRKVFNWARGMLLAHGTLTLVSIYLGFWQLPLLITLAPFYGGALQWLCNEAQHTGLPDHQSDFRINSRTILLNPVLQFLYWNMNYHIEHHMYAAVPCYNLPQLHEKIKHDLPYCPNGVWAAWQEIVPIVRKQWQDPTYQHIPTLPQAIEQA